MGSACFHSLQSSSGSELEILEGEWAWKEREDWEEEKTSVRYFPSHFFLIRHKELKIASSFNIQVENYEPQENLLSVTIC